MKVVKKIDITTHVRVDISIKKRVAMHVKGNRKGIGLFYDEAAEEKLERDSKKNK